MEPYGHFFLSCGNILIQRRKRLAGWDKLLAKRPGSWGTPAEILAPAERTVEEMHDKAVPPSIATPHGSVAGLV